MKRSYDELANELKKNNLRLSFQRLKVLEYLCGHPIHPTADQIYTAVQEELPSLSKTTVYSTLNALSEAGMIRAINIEDHEARYDIRTENHGHFKCESCGRIYDFTTDMDSMNPDELNRFNIRDRNVYFRGACPNCSADID